MFNVKNIVGRSKNVFLIKYDFFLENIQPSPLENEQPIRSSRYWFMEPDQTKSFNDFACFNLRESIERVVNNGMSGS